MITDSNRLCEEKIKSRLHTQLIGRELYVFDEVTSTFDKADLLPHTHGAVICAKAQTNGRGRLGRSWQSQTGGIYFSLILKTDIPPEKIQLLTAICALGVRQGLAEFVPCKIKWPNDIISENGKKLCGILTKMQITNEKIDYINVGIGINANTDGFDKELKYASSLKLICQNEVDENEVLCKVLESIEAHLGKSIAEVTDEYSRHCITLGTRVRVIYAHTDESIIGKCIKINTDGSLTVQKDDGSLVTINSGEVSVRGVYGENYV